MDSRRWIRELLLVAVAAGMGWWWRGGDLKVFAQHSGSSSSARDGGSESLAFQFEGAGGQRSLAMWNPGNHTLYVYGGVTQGNAHVSASTASASTGRVRRSSGRTVQWASSSANNTGTAKV